MSFPCTKCGACCRRAYAVSAGSLPVDERGFCAHLTARNECAIYDQRPDICRITPQAAERMGMDWGEFVTGNVQRCNKYIEEDGMPPHFRVNLLDALRG